jgi:uncharacterized protein (DUF1330 family)
MKLQVPLAVLAGVALGSLINVTPQAQKTPIAYYMAEIDVKDVEADKRVLAKFPAPAEAFGGRYLARGGKSLTFNGEPPKRLILVQFDSLNAVRAWRDAPATKQFEAERKAVGSSILRAFAIDGLPQ